MALKIVKHESSKLRVMNVKVNLSDYQLLYLLGDGKVTRGFRILMDSARKDIKKCIDENTKEELLINKTISEKETV